MWLAAIRRVTGALYSVLLPHPGQPLGLSSNKSRDVADAAS
jgi:hypothetical protein